jgi:hypothetical protein
MKKEIAPGLSAGGASTALSGVGPSSAGGLLGGEGMMRSEMKKDEKKPATRTGAGVTVLDHGKPLPKMPPAVKPASSPKSGAIGVKPSALKPTLKPSTPKSTESSKPTTPQQKPPAPSPVHTPGTSKLFDPGMSGTIDYKHPKANKSEVLGKALDAGSGMAAPSNLSGGAALGKENLQSKMKVTIARTKMKKSEWLLRAEQEYANWEKREQFESFMTKRLPKLTRGEIQAIGQTLVLSKSLKAEKALKKMSAAQNYQHSYVAKKEQK